ncbi:MAG: S-DNA-T family DNA segregation ATPase FtsK/SpoIIIE [Motiliproteus sp.]|jgi:S-DNA-T family DNA segregation ATPase FtsK/SpoIIIE
MTERQAFMDFISRVTKEGGLIVVVVGCLFLLLALCTFDPLDPGWSHLGYTGSVRNAGGVGGAWLADFSFSMLGYMAFVLPLMVIYRAWRFLRQPHKRWHVALPYLLLRTLGGVLIIGAGAALLAIHSHNQWQHLPFEAGGVAGLSLARIGLLSLGLVGATLVLLGVLLLGITLYTDLSWLSLTQASGAALLAGIARLSLMGRDRGASMRRSLGGAADSAADSATDQRYHGSASPGIEPDTPSIASSTSAVSESISRLVGKVRVKSGLNVDKPSAVSDRAATRVADKPRGAEADGPHSAETDESYRAENEPHRIAARVAEKPRRAAGDANRAADEPRRAADEPHSAAKEPHSAKGDPLLFAAAQAPSDSQVLDELASLDAGVSTEPAIKVKELKIVPLSETIAAVDYSDSDAGYQDTRPAKPGVEPKQIPSVTLLDPPSEKTAQGYTPEQLEAMSRLLEAKLKDFGVIAEVVEVNPGPVITRFEISPAPGTKVSKITNLSKDLARSMAVMSVRVVEVIAGKSVVGIEIPNEIREMVRLREVLDAPVYTQASSRLSMGLGNDIAGNPVVVNLAKMPHLLVAGTTGSGKSVGVNAMILSLLYKATPDEVRLMMVDPKMLELSIYDGIPHLLTPVITDMKDAATGLRWCVAEMERRYKLLSKMGVRNLAGFNDKVLEAQARGEPLLDPLWKPLEHGFDEHAPAPELETLPYIVVVVDEFADMMMIVGKKVEELIARIAQKARAAGIHLILATQRPSVDVITGLIKANVPTRIAFQVSSRIDSRTILDQGGAENLLGNGDMLYLPAGSSMPVRVHGAFVSDDEVHRSVEAWKKWGPAKFVDEILTETVEMDGGGSASSFEDELDPLYDQAVALVTQSRRASVSAVQRKFKIGYNRAARMVESMEAAGVVSEPGHNGGREVIAPPPVSVN